jgi:hypothetical protein
MITCPNCSTSNPDGAQTCISCGAPLVEAADLPAGVVMPQTENEIPEPSPYIEHDQSQTQQAGDSLGESLPASASQPVQPPEVDFSAPKKDRSLAIILEVVPGLVGFLGIGWIYSGYTNIGIAWLLGFLVWNVIALVICIFTVGLGCLCTLPINLIVLIASVITLNSQIQKHSEQFNP